jgi:hypothetical protein
MSSADVSSFSDPSGEMVASATTFESPLVNDNNVPELNRSVTLFVSGSVSVGSALDADSITLKAEDIREAIGLGQDQFIPPLASASITHFFNPTAQRLGLRVRGGTSANPRPLVEDAAMARDPRSEKMSKFTAVVPSTTQGNLAQKLAPHGTASARSPEQEEQMKKWRGLTTSMLTSGIMETRVPDGEGAQRIVKYDVPLTTIDGAPQPVAYMLEKNRQQFPGFRDDEIADKIHEYDGLQYYSVPPKYLHFLIGSMQDNLIDKSGFALDGDITIDITPLSPILSPAMRKAPASMRDQPMERMIALELNFEKLDLSNS